MEIQKTCSIEIEETYLMKIEATCPMEIGVIHNQETSFLDFNKLVSM